MIQNLPYELYKRCKTSRKNYNGASRQKKCSTSYFNEPEDNMQNQTISELYTDDKKQNILAILMMFLNQVKTFMKILIPRDNL